MRVLAVLCCALLCGCAGIEPGSIPNRVRSPTDAAVLARIDALQQLSDAGDSAAALAGLEALRGEAVVVEAERLRQEILRSRGRLGLLRDEATRRVSSPSAGAAEHYLHGRLLPTTEAMEAAFERAAALDPGSPWPWLGLAFALRSRDPERALRIYARLHEASDAHPAVAVAYANALRTAGRLREALAVYERMAQGAGTAAGIGHLGMAQTLFAIGGQAERGLGWASLLAALRTRPHDPGVAGLLRELLRAGIPDDQVEQCLDVLRVDASRATQFARGAGLEVLAAMLPRMSQPQKALRVLETAGARMAAPEARRLHRRLLLACGDGKSAHAAIVRDLPTELLGSEDNQVRRLWLSLLDAVPAGDDPLADPATARRWLEALRDCGLLAEAELAVAAAVRRHGEVVASGIADEVQREIAFENAIRRLLYRGYSQATHDDLDAFVREARRVSIELLGRDVVDPDVRFAVPLVGEMLDPFASGLALHLARYNKYFVVGRRAGGVPEGLLFTRLSVRDLDPDDLLPVPGRCREVVGVDRSVRSLSGVLGGDLAGVALLSHYLVDHDAVVEWAQSIARKQETARSDDFAILDDPIPDAIDPLDPLDASHRLASVSSMRDIDLERAVLDVIRLHERRHLVDSFHYLPIEANVFRGVGLLFQFGLSPAAIEAEMERRAELAALAASARPEIVLAHVAEFVAEDDEGSPHVRGFTRLAADLVEALVAEGVAPREAAVARWHRLDAGVVRRAASRLLRDLP